MIQFLSSVRRIDFTNSQRRTRDVFSARQAVIVFGTHALAVAAAAMPSGRGLVAFAVLYAATGLGVSLGYHRYLSHGAFRAPRPVRAVLVALGALAFQGGPITWVGFHRAHHLFDDGPGDPHASSRGLVWSHIGWTLRKAPNGYRRQKLRRLTASLEREPSLVWLERYHLAIQVTLFALCWTAFGLSAALWAFPLRIVALWHATWATNSIAHGAGGPRPGPRNVAWLALIGFGEGLHANHHAAPASASFARRPGDFDLGYEVLVILSMFGLVRIPVRKGAECGSDRAGVAGISTAASADLARAAALDEGRSSRLVASLRDGGPWSRRPIERIPPSGKVCLP